MNLNQLPPEWREGLCHETDPTAFLVFADYLEERNKVEMSKAVRWLASNNKTPLRSLKVRFVRESGEVETIDAIRYRWVCMGMDDEHPETNKLPREVFDILPHRIVRGIVHHINGDANDNRPENLMVFHPYTLTPYPVSLAREPLRCVLGFSSVLNAYFEASKALLKFSKERSENVFGSIPNWMRSFV